MINAALREHIANQAAPLENPSPRQPERAEAARWCLIDLRPRVNAAECFVSVILLRPGRENCLMAPPLEGPEALPSDN